MVRTYTVECHTWYVHRQWKVIHVTYIDSGMSYMVRTWTVECHTWYGHSNCGMSYMVRTFELWYSIAIIIAYYCTDN